MATIFSDGCTEIKHIDVYSEPDQNGKTHYYAALFMVKKGINHDMEYEIPKIDLDICEDTPVRLASARPINHYMDDSELIESESVCVQINGTNFKVEEVSDYITTDKFGENVMWDKPIYYVKRIVNEKPVEVTMEDIEKKFGCKVKIVKEKDDD